MKVQFTKRDIESAVSTASICMSSGTDIFAHFVFRIEDQGLQLLASNGQTGVVVPVVTTELSGSGSFAVEGWRIKQWLSGVDNSVLSFEMAGKKLDVKSDRGTLSFQCLDTRDFPFWDAAWGKANDPVELDTSFFIRALNHVKGFVASDRDTDAPELSVCEVFEDVLGATNITVMASVCSKALTDVKLRIHGRNIGTLVKFLGTTKKDPVKVYSTDEELFVERQDGAVFVVAKPPHEMVKRPIPDNTDFSVTFNRAEFTSAMTSLLSTAEKETDQMTVSFGDKDLVLGVDSLAGPNTVSVPCTVNTACLELPSSIDFSPTTLQKAIDRFEGDDVNLEIVLRVKDSVLKGGLFRVKEEDDGATFSVVLIWKV